MKLGGTEASPFNMMESKVAAASTEILNSDEEVEKAKENLFDEEESSIFWEQVRREQARRQVFTRARSARLERELEARFGMLKGVARHPLTVKIMDWYAEQERPHLVGKAPVPVHASVVILFMAYRGKMPPLQLSLLACFLLAVHPIVVLAGFILAVGFGRRKKPKKLTTSRKFRKNKFSLPTCPLNTKHLDLPISQDINQEELYDFTIDTTGPFLSRLYCGALLSRAGFTVAVVIDDHDKKQIELKPKHAPCNFSVPFFIGQMYTKYASLIGNALIDDLPFYAVPAVSVIVDSKNAKKDTFVFLPDISFLDTVASYTRLNKIKLVYLFHHVATVAEDVLSFLALRLPIASIFGFSSLGKENENPTSPNDTIKKSTYQTAASYTLSEAIIKILKQSNQGEEQNNNTVNDLTIQRLSILGQICIGLDMELKNNFAEWCFAIAHGMDGFHRPPTYAALANALARTIVAHGGILYMRTTKIQAKNSISLEPARPIKDAPQRTLLAFELTDHNLPLNIPIIIEQNFSLIFSKEKVDLISCIVTTPSSRNTDTILAKISEHFPRTKDRCVFISPAGAVTIPAVLPGAAGIIATGWLAAHKALGYKKLDLLYFNRSLFSDYLQGPRHAPLIPVPSQEQK